MNKSQKSNRATSSVQRDGSAAPSRGCDEREAWWCPTCKTGLVWHQVTYEETHDSRYGGCGEPVQPNDEVRDPAK